MKLSTQNSDDLIKQKTYQLSDHGTEQDLKETNAGTLNDQHFDNADRELSS